MLTKQDLKSIGDLIDTKLEEKLESKLEEKLESKLAPIQKDIQEIKSEIKKINKNMERDFGFHETQNRYVIENVQNVQRHLGIPVMTFEAPEVNNF